MYLISLYFDKKTNQRIQQYMNQLAKKTGNTAMIDGQVPPHITISAFETKQEDEVIERFKRTALELQSGTIQWVSVGTFLPSVFYIAPVLNEYLDTLSKQIYNGIVDMEAITIRPCYRPLQWMPHTTIAKQLSKEEMLIGFQVMQNQFGVFSGKAVKIGLAKTNPYRDLMVVDW